MRARWWKNKPKTTLGVPGLREEAIVAVRNRIHEEEEGEGLLEDYHQSQGQGSGAGTQSERVSPRNGHRGTEALLLDGAQGQGSSTSGAGGIRSNGRRKVDDSPV